MKTFLAVVMGLFSGFLIYMMVGMLVIDPSKVGGGLSPALVLVLIFGGWIASSYLLLRNARSVAKVASRGFLLGAAEWMIMIFVGLAYSGKAIASAAGAAGGSDAATAGAAIGGGLIAFLTGGFSALMILICLAGFAIAYFMGKEMKAEALAPSKKCPQCAEMVQRDARKCRFCGSDLTSGAVAVAV